MSNEEHSGVVKPAVVSIGRAFEELDDYLAENDETYRYNVEAGLAGLKRAVASQQADASTGVRASSSSNRQMALQHLNSETIEAYVDGELRMNAYLRAAQHLSDCQECAVKVEAEQQARITLRRAGRAAASNRTLHDGLTHIPLAESPAANAFSPQASPPGAEHALVLSGGAFGTIAIAVKLSGDIVTVRQTARELASKLRFSLTDMTMIATAVAEIARNITSYAGTGEIRLFVDDREGRQALVIQAEDQGPGIPDTVHALEDGYSTGRGLGLGLPGARRLMDRLVIDSTPGQGTLVEMWKWVPPDA